MFKRILVATDGSALSKKAVTSAIALAATHDADLVALNVVPRYPKGYFDGAMSFSPEDIALIEKQWADKAEAMLDTVKSRAEQSGVRVKTATANSENKRIVVPFSTNIGRKTATSDTVVASTAKPTSRLPSSAARRGGSPRSIRRWIFSSITIASSTTRPIASTRPSSVRILIE